MVLATVKGDVHDIGKNLVDIILTNNGYTVVNIGIKQPISAIIEAAESNNADVIGMSGLLVKSTVIMRENLEEMNARGIGQRFPVVLGGAALTRSYVEQDLAEIYDGEVRYARDAFEGLRLMDAMMGVKRGVPGAALPERRARRVTTAARPTMTEPVDMPARSDVAIDVALPDAAVLGRPRRQGRLAGRVRAVHRRARAVPGPVGPQAEPRRRALVRGARRDRGPSAAALVARPHPDRRHDRARRRLRLLPLLLRGRLAGRAAPRGPPGGAGARALHVPAAAPRPPPVPLGLLPAQGVRRDRRRGLHRGDDGPCGVARPPRRSSSRTPTATTSSCTACRSS